MPPETPRGRDRRTPQVKTTSTAATGANEGSDAMVRRLFGKMKLLLVIGTAVGAWYGYQAVAPIVAAHPLPTAAWLIGWWMSANNDCVRQLERQYLRAGASIRWTEDRFEARFRPHGQVGGILLYSGTDLEVLAGGRWVHTAYLCEFSPGADETNITVAAVGTAPGR